MREITKEAIRAAMQGWCNGGQRISNAMLYSLLNIVEAREKDLLRNRMTDMVRRGEAIKIASGVYEYNFQYRLCQNRNDPLSKLWRFVRTQKPGWSVSQACQLAQIAYTQAARIIGWLENEGYIARHGRDGNTVLYRATEKADKTPETPVPPITDRNPFERENAAAAQIARLMLCNNPYLPKTAREIVAACHVLLARFEKGVTQLENTGETA